MTSYDYSIFHSYIYHVLSSENHLKRIQCGEHKPILSKPQGAKPQGARPRRCNGKMEISRMKRRHSLSKNITVYFTFCWNRQDLKNWNLKSTENLTNNYSRKKQTASTILRHLAGNNHMLTYISAKFRYSQNYSKNMKIKWFLWSTLQRKHECHYLVQCVPAIRLKWNTRRRDESRCETM
jgi:hypothetical protein